MSQKKTILITGVTGNLGSAVAKRYLEAGYTVFGIARREKRLEYSGEAFHFITADLSKESEARAAVDKAIQDSAGFDVAVLTAGGFAPGGIASMDANSLHHMMQINFETAVNVARPLFEQMQKSGEGRLYLTGASTAINIKNAKGAAAYGLSKSLVFRLAELLNAEATNSSVFTGVIAPSIIDTPANRDAMPDADFTQWEQPNDIAETIFLHSQREIDDSHENVIKDFRQS